MKKIFVFDLILFAAGVVSYFASVAANIPAKTFYSVEHLFTLSHLIEAVYFKLLAYFLLILFTALLLVIIILKARRFDFSSLKLKRILLPSVFAISVFILVSLPVFANNSSINDVEQFAAIDKEYLELIPFGSNVEESNLNSIRFYENKCFKSKYTFISGKLHPRETKSESDGILVNVDCFKTNSSNLFTQYLGQILFSENDYEKTEQGQYTLYIKNDDGSFKCVYLEDNFIYTAEFYGNAIENSTIQKDVILSKAAESIENVKS